VEAAIRGGGAGPLLRIDSLSVRFGGVVALDGVSFDVAPGEIVGLMGPNGAGKTTLFNCVSGLCPKSAGQIVFEGRSLASLRTHRIAALGISRTFQNLALFRSMTVLDNVKLGRHCRSEGGFAANALRLPATDREEQVAARRGQEMLTFLGLDQLAARRVSDLPFNKQRLVEVARALVSEPKLLLLDEPASGLDRLEIETMAGLIRDLRDRLAVTVLLVEHRMDLLMHVSDRVVALDFGRKIAEGAPDAIRADPRLVAAYLGARH